MLEITAQNVCKAIDNIKFHSAPSVDNISPKFIKLAKCVVSPYLATLFNKCIHQEIFPNVDFKLAYVIPNPKNSSPKFLDEFRSISLLVFSKIIEKMVIVKLSHVLAQNKMLTS